MNRRGFSLAEVVVATTLFALAAVVLGRAVADNLALMQRTASTDHSAVMWNIRQHVLGLAARSELEAGGEREVPVVERGEDAGETVTLMVAARWEAELLSTPVLNVFAVDLTVLIEADGGTERMETRLFVYRPNWADAEAQQALIERKEETFRERMELRGGFEE